MSKLYPSDYNQKLSLDDMRRLYEGVRLQDCIENFSEICHSSSSYNEEKAHQFLFFIRQLMIQKGQN